MNADDLAWGTVTPKRCRHLREHRTTAEDGGWSCRCGHSVDGEKVRRGRLSRARGNRIQRERNVGLGLRNLAGNNPNWDGVGEMFASESKSGGAFSVRYWRWLKGIPRNAQQVPVLIVTEAPGPGRKARSYVVVDYDDWRDLHGEFSEEAA